MKYVADTHSLFWFQTGDSRLGKIAKEIFERAESGEITIIIPSIVLLELLWILEKKSLQKLFKEIIEEIDEASNYEIFPLELEIIKKVSEITSINELHDRIIVATAKLNNCKIITRDKEIIGSREVECVW